MRMVLTKFPAAIDWMITGQGLLRQIRGGRNIAAADVANDPIFSDQEKARYRAVQVVANLNVPLLKHGRPVALLAIHQAAPRQWTTREVSLAEETAERTWATVERARAEEALRHSRNQFNVLTQNIETGVALIDEHGKFAIVNPAFLRLFDLPDKSDIRNVNDRDWGQWQVFAENGELLHADEHPVRKAALTRKAARNQLVAVKSPAGGSLKWFDVSAEPILRSDGHLDALICTYHEVTEHKRAEEALRKSERRYSALFANKINGMAHCRTITDEQGRPVDYLILQINEAYEEIIGVKKADVEGRKVTEVFPDIESYGVDYIGLYGKVALEGGEIKFEEFFEALPAGPLDLRVQPRARRVHRYVHRRHRTQGSRGGIAQERRQAAPRPRDRRSRHVGPRPRHRRRDAFAPPRSDLWVP